MLVDLKQVLEFLEMACEHYEHSAPVVSEYLDHLYRRINEHPEKATILELHIVDGLMQDGVMEQPNYAANRIYKLMSRIGMDTTGLAGF